jgi:hypothetical protein
MSFLQAIVFWMTVGAMLSTFIDIEKARAVSAIPLTPPDGLQPVNRKIADLAARQL